ncbi:UNVERIFIED_CONTAM: hypothetical protein NY603_19305, partial [Bacteroidetes bacterium 56_B9]
REKLSVGLHSSESTHCEHSCPIDCEQGTCGGVSGSRAWLKDLCSTLTYAVEFAREDFQYNQSEAELAQACSDVCTFECSLRGTDFD